MAATRDVTVFVGSLRRDSITRKVANALVTVAPATLALEIVPVGDRSWRRSRRGSGGSVSSPRRVFPPSSATNMVEVVQSVRGYGVLKSPLARRLPFERPER